MVGDESLHEKRKKVRRAEDKQLLEQYSDLESLVCPMHFEDKKETKEHREMVCKKIEKKADAAEVRSMKWVVGFLVIIGLAVFSGGLVWFKHDFNFATEKLDKKIDSGFTTLHRRITETQDKITANMEIRDKNETEQIRQLGVISGRLDTFNWRMLQLEAGHGIQNGTKNGNNRR